MRGDQLARQWQLIQRLGRSRAGVGLEQLADDLGCVKRTVYRDLDALQYAGFPVVSEKRDGRVFYRFLDHFGLGDVPFTTDEVLALAFGEDLLRPLEGTVFHDSIRSALGKIRSALGPELGGFVERLGESFRVIPGPHKRYARYRDVIQVLNEAVLGRRSVDMSYRTGRTGRVSARRLDPYRVWYRSGGLYAIGHDHRSGEVRTFAVDRIRTAELTDRRYAIPASFDFDAYTATSFGVVAEPAARVRIRFDPRYALYVEERQWHPSQKLERLAGGGVELALEVGGLDELRSWVLSFGGGAEVLEPDALRAEVEAELARALERYRAGGRGGRPRATATAGRAAARAGGRPSRRASPPSRGS
jgi:predicted DNA-binding transcriptional regulator YafY